MRRATRFLCRTPPFGIRRWRRRTCSTHRYKSQAMSSRARTTKKIPNSASKAYTQTSPPAHRSSTGRWCSRPTSAGTSPPLLARTSRPLAAQSFRQANASAEHERRRRSPIRRRRRIPKRRLLHIVPVQDVGAPVPRQPELRHHSLPEHPVLLPPSRFARPTRQPSTNDEEDPQFGVEGVYPNVASCTSFQYRTLVLPSHVSRNFATTPCPNIPSSCRPVVSPGQRVSRARTTKKIPNSASKAYTQTSPPAHRSSTGRWCSRPTSAGTSPPLLARTDRKSTRLNSSHLGIS